MEKAPSIPWALNMNHVSRGPFQVKKIFAVVCLFAAGLVFGSSQSSIAQQAQPDASVETSRFNAWTVRCVTQAEKQCQMFQQVVVQQNEQRVPILSVTLAGDRIRFQVPVGFALREPVKLATSQFQTEIPYTVCTQQGCFAGDPTTPEMVAALQRAESLQVTLGRFNGEPLTLDVSLIGFTQAYQRMQAGG